MTTWTSKAFFAGAICLALAGCDDLAAPDGASSTPPVNALTSAPLARGAVALVPAAGYCIDQRSLRANFALLARCDTLGGTTTFGAPLAVITVATVDQSVTAATSGGGIGADGETILNRRQSASFTLVHVKGTPPDASFREEYWRGVGQVGGQVLGLAIYQGMESPDLGERAPDLLAQTLRNTQRQTAKKAAAKQDNSATTPAKPVTN